MVGKARSLFIRARELGSHRHSALVAAGVVLVLAVSIRAYKLDFGLPYLRHPDEGHNIRHALRLVAERDPNPHFFRYPSLIFYINALANVLYFWVAKLFGAASQFSDIRPPTEFIWGVGIAQPPTPVLLGRILSASFSVGTALLGFAIGRRLGGVRAGLLCGVLVALSPINVAHARYLTPDAMTTFFVTLTLFGAVSVFERGKLSDYCLAGAAAGLAAGSKYNGGLVAVAIVAAHFARPSALKDLWRLGVAGAMSAIVFLATTPYMLLDAATFKRDLAIAKVRYSDKSSGLASGAQDSLSFYLDYLDRTEGAFIFLAGAFVLHALLRRSRAHLFFCVFPLLYLGFISRYVVHNDRTLLPVVPALWIMAALGLLALVDLAIGLTKHRAAHAAVGIVAVSAVLFTVQAEARESLLFARWVARHTIADEASEWIAANLAPGARVAVEPYGPFVDGRFIVKGFPSMGIHTPGWYLGRFDYLVLSTPPRRHAHVYQSLRKSFPAVKVFTDGLDTIEVLRTH